jgi:hypothetical protein
MMNFKQAIAATAAIILMTLCSVSANVYVFGVVVDTSDNAVEGASIIISTGGPGGGEILDTLTSGANGAFAEDIVYGEDLSRVRYSASKTGYNTETGMEDVVRDTADLDTIVLRGETISGVYVFGIVVDTADIPVNEARIILKAGGGGGEIIDTLFSGTDGTFGENVEVSGMHRRIRYEAWKNGYQTTSGSGEIEQDTCDLDTITLRDGPTAVTNIIRINLGKTPDNIQLFNMRGQILYSGRTIDLNKVLKVNVARSQMLIAHFRLGNTVLYKSKVMVSQ